MLSNNKGFSLIELMVVVAIIAILSTIAIPSYQAFQAKARQKEGLGLLSSYYTSAHAVQAELGGFPGNFVLSGFSPTGQLGYRLVAENSGIVPTYVGFTDDPACVATNVACTCAGDCANFQQWDELPIGVLATSLGPIGPATAGAVTAREFTVAVAGVIETRAAEIDEWTMNERKVLTQITDGTK